MKAEGNPTMETIENILRDGGRLHAFRSGGGLRVLRVERNGALVGYGEHPHVDDAFRIIADDLKAGGRDYKAVYGPIETPYRTGSSQASGPLDAWLLQGQTFDAFAEDGAIVVKLCGWQHEKTPADIMACVLSGETVRWASARGLEYESKPSRFPNGEPCVSTRCLTKTATGADPWVWRSEQTGRAQSLVGAIDAALSAPPSEAPSCSP